ncbi:transposase, partial [Vibrio lentus]|nr:transposase [Vibrio lentus]
YLIEPTEENSRLAHEHVNIFDYPNGGIAIQYGHRKLEFKTFDKLEHVQQTQIVDNKRLGQVLKFAQQQQEEFEQQQQRTRSKKAPKRRAQQRALQTAPRTINPVLTEPFKASSRKT